MDTQLLVSQGPSRGEPRGWALKLASKLQALREGSKVACECVWDHSWFLLLLLLFIISLLILILQLLDRASFYSPGWPGTM